MIEYLHGVPEVPAAREKEVTDPRADFHQRSHQSARRARPRTARHRHATFEVSA